MRLYLRFLKAAVKGVWSSRYLDGLVAATAETVYRAMYDTVRRKDDEN
jgi:hypothetical protein